MTGIEELTIPASQLETWSRFVDAPNSKQTADLIKLELERYQTRTAGYDFNVYLQGSYRNSTNIFRDSDVDIVVELKDVFYSDVTALTPTERELRNKLYSSATKSLSEFRIQVFKQLQDRFGSSVVKDGDKAIAVGGIGERLNADVLVCAQYRKWHWFKGTDDHLNSYAPGITFWTQKDNTQIVNFPIVHYDNGVAKHDSSRQWFKRTVRAVKNARRKLYGDGVIPVGSAPSYFVQCLIYNVPDSVFGPEIQSNYTNVLTWLNTANLSSFTCQHGQHVLFGDRAEQWSEAEARKLITELIRQWNNWV